MIKISLSIITLLISFFSYSQDTFYVRKIIDTLTSPYMHGRGYVFQGINIAANYLKNEFETIGLKKKNNSYSQPLSYPVNTFPGKMEFIVNKKKLKPGIDWIPEPTSASVSGTFKTMYISDLTYLNENAFFKMNTDNKFIILNYNDWKNINKTPKIFLNKLSRSRGVIVLTKKINAGVSDSKGHLPIVFVDSSVFDKATRKIKLDIETKLIENFPTENIIGYIEGKVYPDSFIIISAHYDHLGRIGANTYIPGANDNASGVAMMLDLARYFSKEENKPNISIVFIAFTGEEIGLKGSFYYTSNPIFSLEKTKFVINLDLMGNGSEGITIVNGSIFEKEFNAIDSINSKNNYVKTIGKRGEAANSDHYPFHLLKKPSFFIYTLGEANEYHNPNDTSSQLTLKYYNNVFSLIHDFIVYLTQ